jgi:thymidylate kinase
MHPDIETFLQSLRQTGASVNFYSTPLTGTRIQCNYICNSDGSIRWIWPSNAKHADFLKFYHAGSLTARLFMFSASSLARIAMLSYLKHGSFIFYVSDQYALQIKKLWNNRWAWFSGTPGPNRKSILWHYLTKSGFGYFLKIPLTSLAVKNLIIEADQLKYYEHKNYDLLIFPKMENLNNGILRLQDIGKGTSRSNQFKKLPYEAVSTWLKSGLDTISYENSAFKAKLDQAFEKLDVMNDRRIPAELFGKIYLLKKQTVIPEEILVSNAHGDFTPWNVMCKHDKLHIIDLELAQNAMPVLFDLFHFIYQSNILLGNGGYKAIRVEIDELFAQPQWKTFLEKNQIDKGTAETLYLLYIVSYYLNVYHQQSEWHVQVGWLLTAWSQALSFQLKRNEVLNARSLVLRDLGQFLDEKKYAVLKWTYGKIDSLPEDADLDICITRSDARKLISELEEHPLISKIKINRKSFMSQVDLICLDNSLIHLDLIYTFKRKAFVFLDAAALLNSVSIHPGGLKIPAAEQDAEYIRLFYELNYSIVPERYQQSFKPSASSQLHLKNLQFQQGKQNRGWRRCRHLFNYFLDTMQDYFTHKGFIVTFSGVDGSGKSTVIANIHRLTDKKLRQKVIVLRHRPGLLPIISAWKYGRVEAETMSSTNLPRLGKNKDKWSSLFRFAYYYLDYFVGQWYVQIRYVSRGYIVLYDRYYFDFINDSRRSNIHLSSSFTAWWYKFLIKPKLNFFLYADDRRILERKQELDAETIQQLTGNYQACFNKLGESSVNQLYIQIENIELSDTLLLVFNHIKTLHYESFN